MKLVFLFGRWASAMHGSFDIDGLYEKRGLTGSESDFFNMAWDMAARGHDVTVLCDTPKAIEKSVKLGGARVASIDTTPVPQDADAYLAWNEPDLLRECPPNKLRIIKQELNDFGYCAPGFDKEANYFSFLSVPQMEHILKLSPQIPRERCFVAHNSTNMEFYGKELPRDPRTAVYCSSPDRGLHRLVEIWPDIRRAVPDAKLLIFYEFARWYEKAKTWNGALGMRARYIKACLDRLGSNGENGIYLRGNVSNVKMAEELLQAGILAYTCDPTTFTEGFSISTLDACAAGAIPIISDADALAHIYREAAIVIEGPPAESRERWITEIARTMTGDVESMRNRARSFAQRFSRQAMGSAWEKWLTKVLQDRSRLPVIEPFINASEDTPPEIKVQPVDPDAYGKLKLRIALIYGHFSSHVHGKFDPKNLFGSRGLTGSESCFWNLVRGLSELGHQVDAFCDVDANYWAQGELAGAHVYTLGQEVSPNYDAYLAWNEPDLLRRFPKEKLRICVQQLNDFWSYSQEGYDDFADIYVMPSEKHKAHIVATNKITPSKAFVIPNSINLEHFKDLPQRSGKHSIVWSSSPDRGLHVLLDVFPEVRKKVPDAILKIFYRFEDWYEGNKDRSDENGVRARRLREQLDQLGRYGENGVVLMDGIPNKKLHRELAASRAFAYTCEPKEFTEGFSVSTMDACAAGCPPIISDADSLGEIYKDAAVIIPGKPSERLAAWFTAIKNVLTDDAYAAEISERAKIFAQKYDRTVISRQWERFIARNLKR